MRSDSSRKGWIVRTGDDYLIPQGGDIGYTPILADVGAFETEEETIQAGREHCDSGFVVMCAPR